MKKGLNLTIEDGLLANKMAYARGQEKSISALVAAYFEKSTGSAKRKSIIDRVEALKKLEIDPSIDLKELFYQDQAKKYGF